VHKVHNLQDLANLAGVSASTVSRALADSPLLPSATRERIKHLAHQHAFHLNVTARNLRIRRTARVAVAIPAHMESVSFFSSLLGRLVDGLAARGLDLLLARSHSDQPDWLEALACSGRVDGMILLGQSDQFARIEKLAARYRALVVWGAHVPGQIHCSVGSDNHLGGELAARHLLEKGCQHIAFLGDPTSLEIGQRLAGARAAVARAEIRDAIQVIPQSLDSPTPHQDIFHYLNVAPTLPDGIFAASDLLAMNALKALRDCGLSVPDDVRVIGFDGLALGQITVPTLSTIRQDLAAGAALLLDRLERRMAGEDATSVIMPPCLQVRLSS